MNLFKMVEGLTSGINPRQHGLRDQGHDAFLTVNACLTWRSCAEKELGVGMTHLMMNGNPMKRGIDRTTE